MSEPRHEVFHRQVLVPVGTPCSIDGCEREASNSITIHAGDGEVRYFACGEHIGPMREALDEAMREVFGE